jgi:hypothetical protein
MFELKQRIALPGIDYVKMQSKAGTRIELPPKFDVFYNSVGSIKIDNLSLESVVSTSIWDKHYMWIEPQSDCNVTLGNITKKEEELVFGYIILEPVEPQELEVIITGIRKIPEIDALHAKRKILMYSPEIVDITFRGGSKTSYRDIDFVHCCSSGLMIPLETPLKLPAEAQRLIL